MFWFFKKKTKTKEQEKLDTVISILFPPEQIKVDEGGDKYYVDHSLDSNLESVLFDLEEGINDEVTRQSLRHICNELYKVRELLETYREVPYNVNYYVVKNNFNDDISHIPSVEE